MPLAKPSINAAQTETRARELLNEFLKGWFDGDLHLTPMGNERFPLCELTFNQALPTQTKPVIHSVFADSTHETEWVDGGQRVKQRLTMHTFVRVQNQGATGNKADHECAKIADLLKLLFQTPGLRAPLAQKGILHPKVLRPPVANAFPGWQVRFMVLRMELTYVLLDELIVGGEVIEGPASGASQVVLMGQIFS